MTEFSNEHYTAVTACRGCGHTGLLDVIDLGLQQVVDFERPPEKTNRPIAPLVLAFCQSCTLLQLRHSVNPDLMYRQFWYKSGMNESMVKALASITEKAVSLVRPKIGDMVLDIGANDGTLLNTYPKIGLLTVGVEPAQNFEHSERHRWVPEYFSTDAVFKHCGVGVRFKIITAIAMFYDLENPAQFLQQCHRLLDENGLLIIQMNYLPAMLENMAFDNISHEHLTYFSLSSLQPLVQQAGLEIVGVSENEVNGGSLRVYITHHEAKLAGFGSDHPDYWKSMQRTHAALVRESNMTLDSPTLYAHWGATINFVCEHVRKLVSGLKVTKRRVALYGASTRGSTLMQTMYPGEKAPFPFAAERDETKIGLRTAGYKVPIISEKAARDLTDVFLVLPWHFREAILEREKSWIQGGGSFIFPLPVPEIVNAAYLRRMEDQKQTAAEA